MERLSNKFAWGFPGYPRFMRDRDKLPALLLITSGVFIVTRGEKIKNTTKN
jgi:hypothetical protein